MSGTMAGKLDRRISLQKRVLTKSSLTGQPIESFDTWRNAWARMVPVTASEQESSETLHTKNLIIWEMRPVPTLSVLDRIEYKGTIYKITGITEKMRNELLSVQSEIYG